jgi:hypothetical protein
MIKKIINLFSLGVLGCISISTSAIAKEEWFCTEQSSQIQNGAVQACGIGIGKDEAQARLRAFDNAQMEFKKICDASLNCKGHEATVDPKRTTCEPSADGYKCYRMVAFEIQPTADDKHLANAGSVVPLSFASQGLPTNPNRDPKLKKGMKKSEVISLFGNPDAFQTTYPPIYEKGSFEFQYQEKGFCRSYGADLYGMCIVSFNRNGIVTDWTDFNPRFATDLDDKPVVNLKNKPQSYRRSGDVVPNQGEVIPDK